MNPDGPFHSSHDAARLYGSACATQLARLHQAMRAHAPDIAAFFHRHAEQDAISRDVLPRMLPPQELERFKVWQTNDLLSLASPDLTADRHRDEALRLGRLYAQLGLPQLDLMHGQEILYRAVEHCIDTHEHAQALAIMSQRLMSSLAWQAEAHLQQLAIRQELLQDITRLAWGEIDNYADMIAQAAKILTGYDNLAGCAFVKPDEKGVFHFEYIAGTPELKQCLIEIDASNQMPGAYGEGGHEHGTMGRAWYSTRTEYSPNVELDPRMRRWESYFARHKAFRSLVAIPLCRADDIPIAVLCLFGKFPGGLVAADQQAFVEQLRTLLLFACTRQHALSGPIPGMSYNARQRWIERVHEGNGLDIRYQPVVDLATGIPLGIHAQAYLQDGDRLLPPSKIVPLLSSGEFFGFYCVAINQAMAERESWRRAGLGDRRLGLNLRYRHLADPRYLHEIQAAMARHNCPGSLMTLHILDLDEPSTEIDAAAAQTLAQIRGMGARITADDLGAGHGSLDRLRQLPFNTIKIDRKIISQADKDPISILCFVHRLTRLGHTLGKGVHIEGVESLDMLEAVAVLKADAVQGGQVCPVLSKAQIASWLGQTSALAMPIHDRPRSKLAKLASLLLWEERVHLTLECPAAIEGASAHAQTLGPVFPFLAARSQQRLLFMAARDHGLHSDDYRNARQQFISRLFREEAFIIS